MTSAPETTVIDVTINAGAVLLVAEILRLEWDVEEAPYHQAREAIDRAKASLSAQSELLKGNLS